MEIANIGKLGEDIACKFLVSKGHRILERNFRVKAGEIDIVSKNGESLYVVEVKTTLGNKIEALEDLGPEENVHAQKLRRLSRAARLFLTQRSVPENAALEFVVVAITLDTQENTAYVNMISETLPA